MTIMIWHNDIDDFINFMIFIILKDDDSFIVRLVVFCYLYIYIYILHIQGTTHVNINIMSYKYDVLNYKVMMDWSRS